MDFYTSISKHYDYIFPYSPTQVKLVKHILPTIGTRILDIGCGTGSLSRGLANAGYIVEAIDYDEKMVEQARNKYNSIHFQQMNMLDIDKYYKASDFDSIVTFGNTLVHLLKNEEIENFLASAYKILKKDGLLAIQILNYQNVVENEISSLPLIENEEIKFERNYTFRTDNLINFTTRLTVKKDNQTIDNTILLNPIYHNTLKELIQKAGFYDINTYGNFKMEELKENSIPLIIVGRK